VHIVLCNPKLVKTGLNLIAWPSIVVLEPVYSLFTLAQAKRRAFRPTQTQDCDVTYVCYAGTMSEKAISIVARKSAAAAILNGDDLSNGLLEFDPGMSLLQELAKAVMAGDEDRSGLTDDVRAMLRDGAAALKADLESGAAGLVGIASTHELPCDTYPVEFLVEELVDGTPDGTLAPGADDAVIVAEATVVASTAPIAVDLPLLAGVADTVDGASTLLADSEDGSVDVPVQLSLFGDTMPAPAHHPRRAGTASTRGLSAAA